MIGWQTIFSFAGGVGLFLLGMRLMSDGLRIAAGDTLRDLLLAATGSRIRALFSGVLVTALVQSSSAVIFAVIGFVNAGLLSLGQAVGLVFGANLGTTFTAWIVAAIGLKLDLQVVAMPCVALGMAMWLASRGRKSALGQALVGFAVFFIGLDVLQEAFAGVGQELSPSGAGSHIADTLLYAGSGVLLTLLMQSSSAALAVTLTAAAQGLVPLSAAAALVVGANLGTTSTAVFASLGATPAARRTAAAHVTFNVAAGVAALIALPWLLQLSGWLVLTVQPGPATQLAMLHTLVNLLGVVLLWPWIPRLVSLLERRIGAHERADEALPRFIDRTVLATPRLAVDAARLELARMGAIAHRMARTALSKKDGDAAMLSGDLDQLERLGAAIIEFVARIDGAGVAYINAALPNLVRIAQYYRGMAERSMDLAGMTPARSLSEEVLALIGEPRALADRLLSICEQVDRDETADAVAIKQALDRFEDAYQAAKSSLLHVGSRGALGAASLVRVLDRLSALRRIVEQAAKAAILVVQASGALPSSEHDSDVSAGRDVTG